MAGAAVEKVGVERQNDICLGDIEIGIDGLTESQRRTESDTASSGVETGFSKPASIRANAIFIVFILVLPLGNDCVGIGIYHYRCLN